VRTDRRECLQIGVIYVPKGGMSMQQIFDNEKGSQDYFDFLSSLGWVVRTVSPRMMRAQTLMNSFHSQLYRSTSTPTPASPAGSTPRPLVRAPIDARKCNLANVMLSLQVT
jgi:hypothetical protein